MSPNLTERLARLSERARAVKAAHDLSGQAPAILATLRLLAPAWAEVAALLPIGAELDLLEAESDRLILTWLAPEPGGPMRVRTRGPDDATSLVVAGAAAERAVLAVLAGVDPDAWADAVLWRLETLVEDEDAEGREALITLGIVGDGPAFGAERRTK